MIDTLHTVETPEGVELELPVAGPVVRLLAWLVDLVVQAALYAVWFWIMGQLGRVDEGATGILAIGAFLILWFYGVAWEVFHRGRTPGKQLLGLQVVREDGTPVGFGPSILRNFLRVVDWLPYCYALGLLSMLIDSSFRRLGDLAAGTLVTYAPVAQAHVPIADVEPSPPPIALEPDERRALIAFAERAPLLSDARVQELASLAAPLLQRDGASDAPRQLQRMAAWLVGSRSGEAAP